MPSHVSNFLGLSILGLAIGIVSTFFNFQEAVARLPMANAANILIGIYVVMFGLSFGLIAATAWGHQNWARWVLLIFYLLGLASLAISLKVLLQMNSFQIGTTLIQTVAQGAALFFIFTGNANDWFRQRKA